MSLRVLYYTLHDLALPSAPTTHVRATVGGLRDRGHTVTVVGTTSDPAATTDLAVHDCGAFAGRGSVWHRGWRGRRAVRRAAATMTGLARAHDVVYARHYTAGRAAPAALPLVYEINGLLVPELRGDGSLPRRLAARVAERELRRTLARAAHVVAVSDGLGRDAIDTYGVPASRVTTIPNGVHTDVVRPGDAAQRARTRREWGVGDDAPVAGIVGSFGLRQRVDWLFDAWPRVLERFPAAAIVLVGPGIDESPWPADARRRGLSDHVVCCGPVPEARLTELYAGLDVSLQLLSAYGPQAQHGSSLKVRTGLAAGKPVISTVHPDLGMLEDERIGRLVPEADPAALADALCAYFADPTERARAGARARDYAVAHLDWRVGVERVEAILRDAVAAGGRAEAA